MVRLHETWAGSLLRGIALCLLAMLLTATSVGCALFEETVPPPVPTNVSASDGTLPGRIQVSWDQHEKAKSYKVDRSMAADGTYSEIAEVTAPPFDDTDVVEGNLYWYKVRGCNGAGCGNPSVPDSGYVRPSPPPPPA